MKKKYIKNAKLHNIANQLSKAFDMMKQLADEYELRIKTLERMNADKEKHIQRFISSDTGFESDSEKKAVEMSETGQSLSQIAKAIFGEKNGQRVKQIRAWIEKYKHRKMKGNYDE